ncbi:hypothetical protein NG800_001490 [Epilithonimonas ginsengisoli]|uniref:Uncharacterized protein n=1 Tax=Epilithonimonas ginsengisoli TaxID=1245592 RepID=A0ABU4JD08_9FLAO|nr:MULTISPECIES: hypothetical protein [Chryseobacterium group]MBV6878539.1 hypothetical protein [Epilithonimonas sp. FP105]MDW8547564.1 hypothetical protein [Epilithonimonas ginsengisoli]
MKTVFVIILIMMSGLTFGQQKKTKKAPPITPPTLLPPPEVKKLEDYSKDEKKCFIYKSEEQKDSIVYVTENLLEYGWAGSNARFVITTYNYDAAQKSQTEKDGQIYAQSQRLRYIDGKYTIQKNILNFTPDKAENYQNRTFKIIYKPKSQKVESLKDESSHQYKKGGCTEPTISL